MYSNAKAKKLAYALAPANRIKISLYKLCH